MHALAVLWFLQLRKTAVPGNLGCAAHQPSPFQVFRMFRGFSQRVESLSGPPSTTSTPLDLVETIVMASHLFAALNVTRAVQQVDPLPRSRNPWWLLSCLRNSDLGLRKSDFVTSDFGFVPYSSSKTKNPARKKFPGGAEKHDWALTSRLRRASRPRSSSPERAFPRPSQRTPGSPSGWRHPGAD